MNTLDATDDLEAVVASLRSLIADDNGPQVLSITEVLDQINGPKQPGRRRPISRERLVGMCERREVPAVKQGNRWTFSLPAIKRWLPTYGAQS